MRFLNKKSFDDLLSRVTIIIILLPFFLLSFFNHPFGDDYWSTGLVRRLGFWHAQVELYNTVPPRWLALGLSCLSPLSWGNFWGYKVIPVVFILLFTGAVAGLLRTLSGGGRVMRNSQEIGDSSRAGGDQAVSRKECYRLAIFFTAIFLSAAPGIGGGIYWVSALIVFGVGLLLFVCWVNLLVVWYRGRRSGWILSGIGVCFMGMVGSNEIITVISLVVLVAINIYRRKIDRATLVQMIIFGLYLGYFFSFKGGGNRYALMQTAGSGKLWYSAGFSILVSGFCILRALTSPFCLAALIMAYQPFVRWCRGINRLELLPAVTYFTMTWLLILFIIPFIVLYLSGLHPPYRVVNMVLFFQLAGLMYFGAFAVNGVAGSNSSASGATNQIRMTRWRGTLTRLGKYRNMAVVLLLVMGFLWKNNVSTATRELVTGSAYHYDSEMNKRYQLILQCKADSCTVPHLRHTSITLRDDSTDFADSHISDYFQKTVIVR